MTRIQQLEETLQKSHQRYEKLVEIIKNNKVEENMEHIAEAWEEQIEDIKSLDDLPDVDLVIELNDGVYVKSYSTMFDTQVAVIDRGFKLDPYCVETAQDIKSYEEIILRYQAEDLQAEGVAE